MSAQNALNRNLKQEEMIPVELAGFFRVWRAKEILFFDSLKAQKMGIFLDLKKQKDTWVNGILIDVTPQELEQMKLREKNYDCIDVTTHLRNAAGVGQIFTFVCKPECQLKPEETDVAIPQGYLDLIKEGCDAIGHSFYLRYLQTTEDIHLPIQEGKYLFIDPVQAKYI
jgi:hypothetical protein